MTVLTTIEYYQNNFRSSPNFKSLITKFDILMTRTLEELQPFHIVTALNSANIQDSSKHTYFSLLKSAITRYISDHNLNIKLDLKGIKFKSKRTQEGIKYLTMDDVRKIKNHICNPKKQQARDLFVLICLSGMSIADAYKFDPKLHMTPDEKWFEYSRTKNGNKCLIPVTDDAMGIINRYRDKFPLGNRIGDVRTFWDHCQWMGELVGKHISAHTGRRTMGCLFLEFGFSLESVSNFLGHTDTIICGRLYARVTQRKIEREMDSISKEVMSL